MTDELFNHIVKRILEKAEMVLEDEKKNPGSEFVNGEKLLCYIILDTIKNDLITAEYDLSECGLDIDLDEKYM